MDILRTINNPHLMAKLTHYTSFEKLKAADSSAETVATAQRTHQLDFEALLTRLRKDFTQQKQAKDAHGK